MYFNIPFNIRFETYITIGNFIIYLLLLFV